MFEEGAEYSFLAKALLALPITVLVTIAWLALQEMMSLHSHLLTLAFILAVYWLILPRKFRILDDRLEIVLGVTYRIPFSEIREVKKGSGMELIFFKGLKFATSNNVIVVHKKKGFSVTISPKNADLFLEQLRASLKAFESKGD